MKWAREADVVEEGGGWWLIWLPSYEPVETLE